MNLLTVIHVIYGTFVGKDFGYMYLKNIKLLEIWIFGYNHCGLAMYRRRCSSSS